MPFVWCVRCYRTPERCAISRQSRYSSPDCIALPPLNSPRSSHLLNSGLVILQPSSTQMNAIIDFLDHSPSIPDYKFPDQELLVDLYKGRWKPLPWWCNGFQTARSVHAGIWDDQEVRLLHYTWVIVFFQDRREQSVWPVEGWDLRIEDRELRNEDQGSIIEDWGLRTDFLTGWINLGNDLDLTVLDWITLHHIPKQLRLHSISHQYPNPYVIGVTAKHRGNSPKDWKKW